jgi:outer membrane protein
MHPLLALVALALLAAPPPAAEAPAAALAARGGGRDGPVASAVGPDARSRDAGDAVTSSRRGDTADGPTSPQLEERQGFGAKPGAGRELLPRGPRSLSLRRRQSAPPLSPGRPEFRHGLLTLEAAIATALAHSDRLGAAAAGLQAAEAGVDEARAARLPTLELSESAHRTTNPVLVFGDLLGQEAFGADDFAVDRLNRPDAHDDFTTRLALSLPLWSGGRIAGAVAAARLGRDAAAAQGERTRQEVIHQVIDAYTGAVAARRRLTVARQALATARAHAELVRSLREGGLVVESDLLSARVRVSELEAAAVRAESAVAVSAAALDLAMGLDLDAPQALPEELAAAERPGEDLAELVSRALAGRPDLAAARSRAQAAASLTQVARAGAFPQIGLSGGYEAHADSFVGADGSNWTVGVGVRFTAFDGFATRARVRQAEAAAEQARRAAALAEQQASLEVRTAFHEVEAARRGLELAGQARLLAERSLTIVEDRYREGLTTLVELLDAETALTAARSREVEGQQDLLRAQATLDLAVGRL